MKRASLKQRAERHAWHAWSGSAGTWSGHETRRLLACAYLAGYRSAAVRNRQRPLVVRKQNIDALLAATRAAMYLTHDERITLLNLFTKARR